MSNEAVHGQLVGEMARAALDELTAPIEWAILTTAHTFDLGFVQLDLRLVVRGKSYGATYRENVSNMLRANLAGTIEDYRTRLAMGVRKVGRNIRKAAEAEL